MKLLFLCFALILPIQGQPDHPKASPDKQSAQNTQKPAKETPSETPSIGVNVVNQQAPTTEQDGTGNQSKSYLSRLFAPENLPNIVLVFFAGAGIIVAIGTLKEMGNQRSVMQGQLDAMKGQIAQMEASGKQTDAMIVHAKEQVQALNTSVGAMFASVEASGRIAAATLQVASATKENADAFMHSQRPWLSLGVAVDSDLTFDEQGGHITLTITVRNVGQMPAMGVWISPEFWVPSSTRHDARDERKRMCEAVAATTEIGQVVFPGEPMVQRYSIMANASEIDTYCRALFGDKAAEADMFLAYIIIVVGYRTAIDKATCFYTAAILDLKRKEPNRPGTYALKRANTPKESLLLYLFPVSGIIAQ